MIKWECRETFGIAPVNVRPVAVMPVPPEMAEKWQREADALGISLDEHLDNIFAEAEEAVREGRTDPTG